MLYDIGIASAQTRDTVGRHEVTLDVTVRKFVADGRGAETISDLDAWFTIALFAEGAGVHSATPLYEQRHRLHSGSQQLVIRVPKNPGLAAVDPFHVMIDRNRQNNVRAVDAK